MKFRLPFSKKSYKPDLSSWDFTRDDMWNIVGIELPRANQLIQEIERILQFHMQMSFRDLVKESLETLPLNEKEYTWMVFYLGQRFQILLIEKGVVQIHPNPPPQTAKVNKKEKLIN